MNLFYIKHHYQSIVRSPSFDGEVFAFVILGILFGSSVYSTYGLLDNYAIELSNFLNFQRVNYSIFLMTYLLFDLGIRLVFRRPLPKLKYYMLWSHNSKAIASQYLFTSFFGIVPFVMVISMLMVASKAGDWLGGSAMLAIVLWWLVNHYVGLISQFSKSWIQGIILGIALLTFAVDAYIPAFGVSEAMMNPYLALFILILGTSGAFYKVHYSIERREAYQENKKYGLLDALPVFSFKNPVFQLEWALLVRNKRTRSNLLFGLASVLILPFIMDNDTEWMVGTLIFFITTGFFIIQHGVYSLGWEGSYFDFLVTNIPPKIFIKTRYLFYVGTCVVGLILASIPATIKGLDWISLFMIFLYNIGVTIPLVLYRSTLNDTKIVLTENSFMNYNGMMTGPIFVSSFLVTLVPLFIYGVGKVVLGSNAALLLGAMGVIGLVLFHPITNRIARKYQNKKYHLSQSFKA